MGILTFFVRTNVLWHLAVSYIIYAVTLYMNSLIAEALKIILNLSHLSFLTGNPSTHQYTPQSSSCIYMTVAISYNYNISKITVPSYFIESILSVPVLHNTNISDTLQVTAVKF
jgi:hypothetical protein